MLLMGRAMARPRAGKRCSSWYAPETLLSEENRRRTVEKFAAMMAAIKQGGHLPPKRAAVLVPICVVDQKVALLYTLRATSLKNHRGQVSFPGGMEDSSDKSLENTALRECEEELGFPSENIKVWGSGSFIVSRSETSVLPVIGQIDQFQPENLKINPDEVEQVFTVPLENLCDPDNLGYTQFRIGSGAYSMPLFLGGEKRIWGLTAIITNLFLRSFLPAEAYRHKLKLTRPVL